MHLALRNPESVESLIVLDIAPMHKTVSGEFQKYSECMLQLDGKVKSKKEADHSMQEHVHVNLQQPIAS
jgi:hypothetical protein